MKKKQGKMKVMPKKKKASSSKKTSDFVVTTRTPALPAFQPDILKNDLVRQTMITILWRKEEITYPKLTEELKKEIGPHFNGDIDLYIDKVKSDLLKKKLLEESPGKRPVHFRLSQKLDKDPEDE